MVSFGGVGKLVTPADCKSAAPGTAGSTPAASTSTYKYKMNQFIFYPKIDIDLDLMRDLIKRNLTQIDPNLEFHQRKVEKEPYLVELQKQYPMFGNIYNIYRTPPGYNTPAHIDSARECALNIPFFNTETSHTVFYEFVSADTETVSLPHKVYDKITSNNIREVFRFTLMKPTVINTKIPHSVIQTDDNWRVIFSWGSKIKYDQVKEMLGT